MASPTTDKMNSILKREKYGNLESRCFVKKHCARWPTSHLAAPIPSFRQVFAPLDNRGLSQALYCLESKVRLFLAIGDSSVADRLGEEGLQLLYRIHGARRRFSRQRTGGSVYLGTAGRSP